MSALPEDGIKISLPLPPAVLNAHGNTHWRKQQRPRKRCRELVCLLVKSYKAAKMSKAVISYRFFFPDDRARDLANYIQMCKPYIDGIVDAGLIPDDRWQVLSLGEVTAQIDRDQSRVEIYLKKVDI